MHDAQVQKIAQACDLLEQEIERGLTRVAGEPDVGPRGPGGHDVEPGKPGGAGEHGGRDVGPGKPGGAGGHGGRDVGPGRPDIGDIALVTALSWLEFRELYAFLPGRPRLAAWYAALCSRPSMLATALAGDTKD